MVPKKQPAPTKAEMQLILEKAGLPTVGKYPLLYKASIPFHQVKICLGVFLEEQKAKGLDITEEHLFSGPRDC